MNNIEFTTWGWTGNEDFVTNPYDPIELNYRLTNACLFIDQIKERMDALEDAFLDIQRKTIFNDNEDKGRKVEDLVVIDCKEEELDGMLRKAKASEVRSGRSIKG